MAELIFLVHSEMAIQEQAMPVMEGYKPGRRVNIGGVQAMFRPLFIPCQFSFAITLGIRGVDFNQSHLLRFVFRDPKGNVVVDSGNNPNPPIQEEMELPLNEANAIISAQFQNVPLLSEGFYKTEIYLDGEMLGGQSIPVRVMKKYD